MKNKKMSYIGYILIGIGLLLIISSVVMPAIIKNIEKNNHLDKKDESTEKSVIDSDNKVNVDDGEEKVEPNAENSTNIVTVFNYDEVEKVIKEKVAQSNYNYYISTCTGTMPDVVSENKIISEESISKIIAKLKKCTRYESNITASFSCAPYSYTVGEELNGNIQNRIFSLNLGDNSKTLVVGYENVGYAFYFDSDVSDFIQNLQ